jgi:hypothetical protein
VTREPEACLRAGGSLVLPCLPIVARAALPDPSTLSGWPAGAHQAKVRCECDWEVKAARMLELYAVARALQAAHAT